MGAAVAVMAPTGGSLSPVPVCEAAGGVVLTADDWRTEDSAPPAPALPASPCGAAGAPTAVSV